VSHVLLPPQSRCAAANRVLASKGVQPLKATCSTVSSSKYSISAVNRITGKSRTTIAKHVQQGKLSYEVDEAGNKLIDAAELIRVYGAECDFDREERKQDESQSSRSEAGIGTHHDQKHLQEQLDREITERTREREQFRQQVEHLQEALTRAQEGLNRTTLLLEDQSKGRGDWEQGLKLLEERFAAQEQKMQASLRELKENASKKLGQYKRALEEERTKGFWKRLWQS
jgi:hypothetical protein